MIPRMAILDAHDNVLGFIDNSTPKGAHIYDTLFHLYLAGSAYTLSFKMLAKDDPKELIQVGNRLSFRYGVDDFYLNIVKIERDEWEISVEAYGLSFELLNEEVIEFECPDPWTFQDYVNHFQAESDLKVTVNEVQEKRIKLSWDGRDTILKRLFSVANSFEAELAFKAKLNNHWGLDYIELEVRRRIGEDRFNQPIRYGQNLYSVKKTIDIVDIYTALYPIGKNGMTLNGFKHSPEDDGIFLDGPVLRSPRQRDLFPAMHIGSDSFIMKYWDCDVDSQAMLYGRALAELRKNSVPKASYEISGTFDLMPGDRVRIIDDQFNPPLYLEARAIEIEICFEDESKSKVTFDNYTELSVPKPGASAGSGAELASVFGILRGE